MNIIEKTAFRIDDGLVTEFFFTRDWTKLAKKIERGVDNENQALNLVGDMYSWHNDFMAYLNARMIPTIKNLSSIAMDERFPEAYRKECAEVAAEMAEFSKRVIMDSAKAVAMVGNEAKEYLSSSIYMYPLAEGMRKDYEELLNTILNIDFEPRKVEIEDMEKDKLMIESFSRVLKKNLTDAKRGMLAFETLAEERKAEIKQFMTEASSKKTDSKKM